MMDNLEFNLICLPSLKIAPNFGIVVLTAGKGKMQGGRIHEEVTADAGGRGEDEDTCSSRSSLDNG